MKGKVLVVAETRHAEVRASVSELLGAARRLADEAGGSVLCAVIGADATDRAADLAGLGCDEVLAIPTAVAHFDSGIHQRALEAVAEAERPDLILFAHAADSLAVAPALAASLGAGFAADVVAVATADGLRAERWVYGGKLIAELRFPDHDTVVLTLRGGVFAPADSGPAAPIRVLDQVDAEPTLAAAEIRPAPATDIDIAGADFLLAIGRGVDQEDEVERFRALAEALGGELAVSRPLVDAGWSESARQVGQSGRSVKPRVYLALGISGAVQHLAGMRDAETIIAVNTDPGAPIFGIADYGAEVDLFDLADALEAAES